MEPTFGTLTLMFPMWNEEEMIHRTVGAARETGEDLIASGDIGDYEILLVDDASTDARRQEPPRAGGASRGEPQAGRERPHWPQ